MTIMADATPTIRFFNEIHATLYACGYDSQMSSLYQVRPTDGPWYLNLALHPQTRTGKRATLALRLDEVSSDGRTVRAGLESLNVEPTNSREAHDKLRHDIESRSGSDGDGMDSTALALFVADALDSAGISD